MWRSSVVYIHTFAHRYIREIVRRMEDMVIVPKGAEMDEKIYAFCSQISSYIFFFTFTARSLTRSLCMQCCCMLKIILMKKKNEF